MKRKLLFTLIVLALGSLAFGTVSAFADTYGDLTYSISNNEIEITDCNTSAIGYMEIPKTIDGKLVTTIGSYAFYGCTGLTSVTIPDSVTTIGNCAFVECKNLTSVTIPNSVTSIGEYAFYSTELTSITIPDNVTTIGDDAFAHCEALTQINWNTTNVADFSVNNGVFSHAGQDGDGISVVFGENVERIPAYIFCPSEALGHAPKVISVNIPNSVTSIGKYAFYSTELTSVTIPDGVTKIEEYTFYHTPLTSVTIPDSVTTIGSSAFCYTELTSVTIPAGVARIEEYTFYSTPLISVTIPAGVTSIGKNAFYGTELTSITIPDSVTKIGDDAFSQCEALTQINWNTNNIANFSLNNGVFSCAGQDGDGISVVFGENVERIPAYIFYPSVAVSYAPKVISVNIPNSVTSIGEYAFCHTPLTSITIPDSVTTIGSGMLEGCSFIKEITLPFIGSTRGNSGTIDSVFGYIFGYETSSSGEETSDTRQYYSSSSYAYYHIPSSLKKVTITDETFIGYGAFYGCTNISDIIIDCNVKGIGSDAFSYHYNLLNVVIKSTSPKFADNMVFYNTDFVTLYGYEDSTVEEYATKNRIDFEQIGKEGNCEINGSIKAINNTLVVSIDLSKTISNECLHIVLYSKRGQMIDYIIVPSDKPFNSMNVVFKDDTNSSYAKVFLWNGFTSMQPLTEAKRIEIAR